jgi:hypothetical protein
MNKSPSTNGPDGRDARGRFAPGNRVGKGNPLAGRIAKLRAALIEAVKPGDVQAIARSLVKKARAGEIDAARLLLAYTLGKPIEADLIDRLERLESDLGLEGRR